jgi:mono/diheme cytochrome c family protein
MRTIMALSLAAATCVLLTAGSQDKPSIKMIPPSSTSAASGPEMFATYCAVCHGKSGKGDGPAAAALKSAPTDLTQMTHRNAGKFPELQVLESITQDVQIGSHGDREMPVWGPVFKSIDTSNTLWRLRAQNLTAYIKSIQAK